MRKVFFILFLLMTTELSLLAEYIACPINGGAVKYIAEEGQIIKKGEILYKVEDWFFKNETERSKVDVELAKAKLEDMQTDITRAKRLYGKKAISLAAFEDATLDYYKGEYELAKSELELKRMQSTLEDYTCSAPYDCKVIKRILCTNSGTQYGTNVMEIQPMEGYSTKEEQKHNKTMILTSYIQGDLITWLPKEGEIVKKGAPLVKFDTTDIDLVMKALDYTIKEADECVKDSATDIERAKTLALNKEHAISTKVYEDVLYQNEVCSLDLKKLKLELEYYKKLRSFYVVPAPYDVKISKRVVSVNSGLKYGTTILKVERI